MAPTRHWELRNLSYSEGRLFANDFAQHLPAIPPNFLAPNFAGWQSGAVSASLHIFHRLPSYSLSLTLATPTSWSPDKSHGVKVMVCYFFLFLKRFSVKSFHSSKFASDPRPNGERPNGELSTAQSDRALPCKTEHSPISSPPWRVKLLGRSRVLRWNQKIERWQNVRRLMFKPNHL